MASRPDSATVVIDGTSYRYLVFTERPVLEIDGLTATERDIATKVVWGWSTQEIAASRGSSARTVANQLRRIYDKLGVQSRHALIAQVVR